MDRYLGRLNYETSTSELHGYVLKIQPDQNEGGQSIENFFCYQPRTLLLQSNAIRTQECRGNVPEIDEQDVCMPDWEECLSLCRRHAGEKLMRR